MKKVMSLVLLTLMVLASLSFAACVGGATTPPSGEGTTPPPSGGGFTWNDMPVYPGASQAAKGTWTIPPTEEGQFAEIEWRHYETGDSLSTVVSFYKSQMPGNGWEEAGWFETPDMHMGNYSKNSKQDVAVVTVTSLIEGGILIALMRASE